MIIMNLVIAILSTGHERASKIMDDLEQDDLMPDSVATRVADFLMTPLAPLTPGKKPRSSRKEDEAKGSVVHSPRDAMMELALVKAQQEKMQKKQDTMQKTLEEILAQLRMQNDARRLSLEPASP